MSGFFARLGARATGADPGLRLRTPARFEAGAPAWTPAPARRTDSPAGYVPGGWFEQLVESAAAEVGAGQPAPTTPGFGRATVTGVSGADRDPARSAPHPPARTTAARSPQAGTAAAGGTAPSRSDAGRPGQVRTPALPEVTEAPTADGVERRFRHPEPPRPADQPGHIPPDARRLDRNRSSDSGGALGGSPPIIGATATGLPDGTPEQALDSPPTITSADVADLVRRHVLPALRERGLARDGESFEIVTDAPPGGPDDQQSDRDAAARRPRSTAPGRAPARIEVTTARISEPMGQQSNTPPPGPGRSPATGPRSAVPSPQVHVHIDRVVVARPSSRDERAARSAPVTPPAPARPTRDHSAYLARRQEDR